MSEGEGAGQRRPKAEDLDPLLEMIWDGESLRKACEKLGLHTPSTSDWLHADLSSGGRSEQYARAREGRGEFISEDALALNRAAATGELVEGKKVDPSGARGYLEAAKWRVGQMAPKLAPQTQVHHTFGELSDEELARRIDAAEAARSGED